MNNNSDFPIDFRNQLRRGKYNTISSERRSLFLKLFNDTKDIKRCCELLDINIRTARNIIKAGGITKRRGGAHHKKVTNEVLEFLERQISKHPTITLKELKSALLLKKNFSLSESSISKNLHLMVYTSKKVTFIKKNWNDPIHLDNRCQYSQKYSDLIRNRHVLYLDEVPFHMWLSKSKGMSKKGIY